MSNFSSSVCLSKLAGAFVADIQGNTGTQRCICVPISIADLQIGKDGNVYLNLASWELQNVGQYGDTHMIKQSLSKDRAEQVKASGTQMPILGNMKPFGNAVKSVGTVNATPVQVTPVQQQQPIPQQAQALANAIGGAQAEQKPF